MTEELKMQEEENYTKLINKYKQYDMDPIQFFININTISVNEPKDICIICHDNKYIKWRKNKCCNGYIHNKCYYEYLEHKYDNIILKFKKITYFGLIYKIITNNITDTCMICRKELDKCKNIKTNKINFNNIFTLSQNSNINSYYTGDFNNILFNSNLSYRELQTELINYNNEGVELLPFQIFARRLQPILSLSRILINDVNIDNNIEND